MIESKTTHELPEATTNYHEPKIFLQELPQAKN